MESTALWGRFADIKPVVFIRRERVAGLSPNLQWPLVSGWNPVATLLIGETPERENICAEQSPKPFHMCTHATSPPINLAR
jgi:hypothetical protein